MVVTIIDVARAAGVSKSTAARALTDSAGVSAEAHARVTAAAEQLGYRANRVASALRAGETRLIGLVVTNLVNASVQSITEVIQDRARSEGYQVVLGVTEGDGEREASILEALVDHRVDGLIIMGTGANLERINELSANGLPVVNLIRRPKSGSTPTVLPDNYLGSYDATRYLIDLGHRSIAFIGGPASTSSGHERFAGFRAAMEEVDIEVLPDLVRRGPFNWRFGSSAIGELLDASTSFTAVLAANHEAMFGVLSTLSERRVTLPRDLSLIGFEDYHWFAHWHPPITVVDIEAPEMATAAFSLLVNQIREENRDTTGTVRRTRARLVIRDSCQPL